LLSWQVIPELKISFQQTSHCKQENHLSDEEKIRLEKVKKLQLLGQDPWPATRPVDDLAAHIVQNFEVNEKEVTATIAGRVMSTREHGKSIFANIQDRSGTIQVYLKQDSLGVEKFDHFKHFIDVGDIFWCSGKVFKTKMGEVTLQVDDYALLSKCLHPMPDKFHGLADIEMKQRQRYLDLMTSQESRQRFIARFEIIKAIRSVLDLHQFYEVETPMLHPIPGGAAAKPFVTHHNALDIQLYLRIAPELFLKRLVVGGFERVYEINRCFRNEGISTRHNPEFTSVEYYIAYHDYHFMMDLTEEIFRAVVQRTCKSMVVQYQNYQLDFSRPFARIAMQDAVAQAIGVNVADIADEKKLSQLFAQHDIKLSVENNSWGYQLYALFEKLVEPHLIQPTFVTGFPVEVSPLAKRSAHNSRLVDRYELFIAHMELSNGFTELNDPFDQASRFADQAKQRDAGDAEAHYYDADFITALEYGMPPTVGSGIGIDRLVMVLTNTPSIRDVILFPTHRPF
jgi:lysyl-tRNA synthetase class 2